MAYEPWYRDRKFNQALQENGSFNFTGFFKRHPDSEPDDPLTAILNGFSRKEPAGQVNAPVNLVKAPCGLYVCSIDRLTSRNKNSLVVVTVGLKLEQPQAIRGSGTGYSYHGYLIKVEVPAKIRRYSEIDSRGTMRIHAFGTERSLTKNQLLDDLLNQIERNKVKIRDQVSPDLASQLYSLWPKMDH